MTPDEHSSLPDVARAICTVLAQAGITVVLTGGSAATYYAPEAYQSVDIDFVVIRFNRSDGSKGISEHLEGLGFIPQKNCYRHPDVPFPIEFPKGPLAVGQEILNKWKTEASSDGVLHVLTPTDSVKDRLAAFIHWNDHAGLAQALAVAKAVPGEVDLAAVASWAEAEGGGERFRTFLTRLQRA